MLIMAFTSSDKQDCMNKYQIISLLKESHPDPIEKKYIYIYITLEDQNFPG